MLGIPQAGTGGCPCPQPQGQPNGIIATPASDTSHGDPNANPAQGRPMCPPQGPPTGPMMGGGPQQGNPAMTGGPPSPPGFPGYGGQPLAPGYGGPMPQRPMRRGQGPQQGAQQHGRGQQQMARPQQMQGPGPQMQGPGPQMQGMPQPPPYLQQGLPQALNNFVQPHPQQQAQLPPPQKQEIQVIVMGEPNEFLAHWLMLNGLEWRRAIDSYDVDVSRNRATREFLVYDVPRGKRYMMMLDADMVPCGETAAMITAPGDVVYCGHSGAQGGRGHSGPGNMAAACLRVSVRCLQLMAQQGQGIWWNMGKDPTRSQRTHCECSYFNGLSRQVGFMPQQVGVIGHMQMSIIFPVNDSPEQWKLVWPAQYRMMIPKAMAAGP